jgi:exonuclease III
MLARNKNHRDITYEGYQPCLLERYKAIHRPLTEEEKEKKRVQNKAKHITNSEGMSMFILKDIFPAIKIQDIDKRVISIALKVSKKHYLVIINIYAPVERNQNNSFFEDLEKKISTYKIKFGGNKIKLIIVGDYNITIHN